MAVYAVYKAREDHTMIEGKDKAATPVVRPTKASDRYPDRYVDLLKQGFIKRRRKEK